jgi:DNA-binding transcriptional LysR family regulator
MHLGYPEVELRQLRAFVIVAEEGHIGRAASRLGVAQPPLSQQIKRLERRIGYPLFERHSRGVRLTDAGLELVPAARAALSDVALGIESARRTARGLAGHLRLGLAASVSLRMLPELLGAYRRAHPDVTLTVRELTSAPQVHALRAGTLDVGIGRETQPEPGINAVPWRSEEIVAVLPATHSLVRRRRVQLGALAGEPFVLFPADAGPAFHAHLLSLCAGAGFAPEIVHEAVEWQTLVAFVAAGLGITIAPASAATLRVPGVVYRALAPPSCHTTISLCWREADRRPIVGGFIAAARELVADPS